MGTKKNVDLSLEHIQTPSQVEGLIGFNRFIAYHFIDFWYLIQAVNACVGLDKEINKSVLVFLCKKINNSRVPVLKKTGLELDNANC